MRFQGKKWIFVGILSTLVLLAMVSFGFCEILSFPDECSDMADEIYASLEALNSTSQETTQQRCSNCHDPANYLELHHTWIPNPPQNPGDPSSPYNPYCPDPPPSANDACVHCHIGYNDNCEIDHVGPWPYFPYGNGCTACHSIPAVCGWEVLELPSQCIGVIPGGCSQEPDEMIQELVGTVIELNLHKGISNSLDAKLQSALGALDDVNTNNDVAAINTLNAFINAVEAQRGNKITDEDADTLIAAAQAIIDKLESP